MRLMLVDDEPRVLEGLERVLWDLFDDLEVKSFTSGAGALAALDAEPFDLLITDMHMPQMDGAELLGRVHARWPGVVRMVLSGHMDEARALKAVTHAHQFLLKPCSAEQLQGAVERASRLRELLASQEVRDAVGGIDKLPVIPAIYTQLHQKLHDPKAAVSEIVDVIRRDPVLLMRTMQLASSALFAGGAAPVTTLEIAVGRLGLRTLQALMLMVAAFDQVKAKSVHQKKLLDALYEHSLASARVVTAVAKGNSDAFMVALLSDIGQLALAVSAPEKAEAIAARVARGEDRLDVEREMLQCTHGDIGGYLLGLWGLPMAIVDAVRFHHAPCSAARENKRLAAIAHVAVAVADGCDPDAAALESIVGTAERDKLVAAAKAAVA